MGPVGQFVKILFYGFLGAELVFSVAIYAMATILLCSRVFIPQHFLLHGSVALFLSIVTLSIIHKGFHAVAHDCPFHLYCFAIILFILLLIQFLVGIFGIRATSRNVWYQQSLPINDWPGQKFDIAENVETLPVKMAYRVPTKEELETRKKQLYGKTHGEPENKHESRWNHGDPETGYPARKGPSQRRKNGGPLDDEGLQKDQDVNKGKPRMTQPAQKTEKGIIDMPLVLVFHEYSFILKIVCLALSILTGFMYQLEYV